MVLMQHHRNLAVAWAEHNFNMQANQRSQALFRVRDALHWIEHPLLRDLHGMVHDLVQDFVFALEVVVEASLAQFERGGHIVHRGRVVSALLKQACGGAQNLVLQFTDLIFGGILA